MLPFIEIYNLSNASFNFLSNKSRIFIYQYICKKNWSECSVLYQTDDFFDKIVAKRSFLSDKVKTRQL